MNASGIGSTRIIPGVVWPVGGLSLSHIKINGMNGIDGMTPSQNRKSIKVIGPPIGP